MAYITIQTLPTDAVGNFTTVVDLSGGTDVVTVKNAILHMIYINTGLSNDAVDIENGLTITRFMIPKKTSAGASVSFEDALMVGGIRVVPDAGGATGSITVVWSLAPNPILTE